MLTTIFIVAVLSVLVVFFVLAGRAIRRRNSTTGLDAHTELRRRFGWDDHG